MCEGREVSTQAHDRRLRSEAMRAVTRGEEMWIRDNVDNVGGSLELM